MERGVLSDEVYGLLGEERYLAALERLLPRLYPRADDEAQALREEVFAALGQGMRTARHPPRTRMKFGTSGWRGLLFEDFTVGDIRVEGLQRTEAGTVFGYLPVKVGETMTEEKAQQAIRTLSRRFGSSHPMFSAKVRETRGSTRRQARCATTSLSAERNSGVRRRLQFAGHRVVVLVN